MSTTFMKVQDVADELGVSKSYAYKIVQKLNDELKAQGFITISGRVNKQYFLERVCYGTAEKRKSVLYRALDMYNAIRHTALL